MKRKIALCISGHYRHFSSCKSSLLDWIQTNSNEYDFDIYFSCWNDFVGIKEKIYNNNFAHESFGIMTEVVFGSDHLNDLVTTLKPKNYSLFNSELYKDDFTERGKRVIPFCDHIAHRPIANISQLFIKNETLNLVPFVKHYDLYIMARFDLAYSNFTINFDELKDINFITNDSHDGFSDLFIVSKTLEPIKKYTELDLEFISKEYGSYSPHSILKYFFEQKMKLEIKTFNFGVKIFGERY